mgnify:CR=1 FL=1
MSHQPPPRLLWIFAVVWLSLYAWSFFVLTQTEATGDGFTRGFNRVASFLLYQFAAAIAAIGVWRIGGHASQAASLRWLSRVPIALFCGLITLIAAIFIYGAVFV